MARWLPILTLRSHRFSTATADRATLPRLSSIFDLDATRHAFVAEKRLLRINFIVDTVY
jgi:hypothetical protein